MNTVFAVLGVLIAVSPTTAHGKKLPPPSKLNLVQAQCPGHPPGPCSPSFAFTSGTAILMGQKEPTPACHDPERAKGGEVRLAGVTKDGAAFSGTLLAQAELQTTFGTDTNNGNCELQTLQVRVPSLSGELTCRNGKCKGSLLSVACLPGTCADTLITTEFISLVVQDDAGRPLATPGTFVAPARSDAP
jgi:hypothetical protein